MDSRSPVTFLPHNNPFSNTLPRMVYSISSPRSSTPPASSAQTNNTSRSASPVKLPSTTAKRKASFQEDDGEDSVMSTSPQPAHRTLKKPRPSTSQQKRPLPISRILDNLEKPQLISLIANLIQRHPGLLPDVQLFAPKLTPQSALSAIIKLEHTLHNSFPYGGDKSGEYAYSRIHSSYSTLLSAISDYTHHFLPPTTIPPAELLHFLNGITNILHRVPLFTNPIHNIARETALNDIVGTWEIAIRYFLEQQGDFAFTWGGWLDRLQAHANKEQVFGNLVDEVRQQVSM